MLKRLSRILLALVTAFVFYGQMEAAAEHCVRLAEQSAAVQETAQADDPPCHQANAAMMHHGDVHSVPDQAPAHHKTPDRCECIAALKMCSDVAEAQAAAHIEPYAWLAPRTVHFVSRAPEPDWRPPRA